MSFSASFVDKLDVDGLYEISAVIFDVLLLKFNLLFHKD